MSYWAADKIEREYGGHAHDGAAEIPLFEGDSKIVGLNAIYKWAPNGNYRERNVKQASLRLVGQRLDEFGLDNLDDVAGMIIDKVEELGVSDNTIIIWTSDNGPEQIEGHHGTAGYWRGNYFTALEGSLRTSFLIRWPNKIPAGRESNEIVHITDLMPTLASIAGYEVPDDRIIDGKDQIHFFMGRSEKSNREGFPVYNGDEMYAYKYRNYKMHFIKLDSMFGTPARLNMPMMYNLITDPKELYPLDKVDVAEAWFMAPVTKRVLEFEMSLRKEPPIPLGTPDPYKPKGR